MRRKGGKIRNRLPLVDRRNKLQASKLRQILSPHALYLQGLHTNHQPFEQERTMSSLFVRPRMFRAAPQIILQSRCTAPRNLQCRTLVTAEKDKVGAFKGKKGNDGKYTVSLIEGDGIGPEIAKSVKDIYKVRWQEFHGCMQD